LLLDTNVLGKLCHPRKYHDVRAWLRRAAAQHELLLSELADYELRRELLRISSRRGIARLDELTRELRYVPVTTATWRLAAQLWAHLRRAGKAGATDRDLDGDVILIAQARAEDATVVTSNAKHFESLVPALDWPSVPVS
jgi:predicted nucleic acid-binding protein